MIAALIAFALLAAWSAVVLAAILPAPRWLADRFHWLQRNPRSVLESRRLGLA